MDKTICGTLWLCRLFALYMQIRMRKASFSQVMLVLVDSPSGSIKMSTSFPTGNILKVLNNHTTVVLAERQQVVLYYVYIFSCVKLLTFLFIYGEIQKWWVIHPQQWFLDFLLIPLQAVTTVSLLIFYKVIQKLVNYMKTTHVHWPRYWKVNSYFEGESAGKEYLTLQSSL